MEHRVKQRSQEWLKLRQSVMLTASQFADAVGVGKGRPFHFFQWLVEKDSQSAEDSFSGQEKQMVEHGVQMEAVIREAYELLTGLRVLESGFWVPEEGHSMEGLIGASPDGVVVNEKDTSRVLGLVEFKAPVYKMYDKLPGTRNGIPRNYMVQIQGQMAVCGAPWCDFMAVCSNTKDIMLKRVYFQPRYWEHISNRLKQFCFALQEAEIMQELGREVFSGAMTQRIKTLPMQENPYPAEDIITVENLLTRSPLQLFRGPSQKLLSYQILVGDTYDLPTSLGRYKQDLLAKVDAEIQVKAPQLDKGKMLVIEEEEVGQVCRRVFSEEVHVPRPVSPETVFREGSAIWGKENVNLTADSVTKSQPAISNLPLLSARESSMKSGTDNPVSTTNTTMGRHLVAKPLSNHPRSVSKELALGSFFSWGQSQTVPPPHRRLSRISAGARQLGRASGSQGQRNVPRADAANSGPRAGVLQSGVIPGNAPETSLGVKAPKAALSHNVPILTAPRNTSRTTVSGNAIIQNMPENSSQAVPSNATRTSPRVSPKPSVSPRARVSGSSPRALVPGPRMSSPRYSKMTSPVAVKSSPLPGAVSALSASSTCTTAVSTCTNTNHPLAAVSTSNAVTKSSTSLIQKPAFSARDEWERSAKRKQPVGKSQNLNTVKTCPQITAAQTESDTSQASSKASSSVEDDVTLTQSESRGGDNAKPSEDKRMHWRAEVLGSGSAFVPPGLTLLSSSGTSHSQQTALDMTARGSTKTTPQESLSSPKGIVSGHKEDQDSIQQALKRPSSSKPEVEPKRPLIDRGSGIGLLGDGGERHRSPERFPIHRPWQSQEEGREHASDPERFRPFGRVQDQSLHSFNKSLEDGQSWHRRGDRVEMGRDRSQDLAHQRLQPCDDRGGSRIQSVLERGREETQARIFEYDHQDRINSDDFHQNRNRGQPCLLANPVSTAVQFDDLRHLPLDLSERRQHQERERDMYVGSRGALLGRESSLGLDRGAPDSGVWRGQFQRQLQHQLRQPSMWQQLQSRSELPALRNPLHGSWSRGQAIRAESPHGLEMQPQLMDRRFPDMEGHDPRLGVANVDFRGDLIRGQYSRNFPRRPFDY